MPSNRRIKGFLGIAVLLVLVVIYITSAPSHTYNSEFYTRTQEVLAKKAGKEAVIGAGADIHDRLHDAANEAKKAADEKGKNFHGEAIRQKAEQAKADLERLGGDIPSQKIVQADEPQAQEVENDMNYILKRSPIIIFSKTTCPFSKKAKKILLDYYNIDPPPHVVELDKQPHGMELQLELGKMTGRGTVPNILINGKSIGGGDDVEELHDQGKLLSTIQELAGKKVEITKKKDM